MFPARAGMSLQHLVQILNAAHVPRASGDEPRSSETTRARALCSPRERG